jgi:aminoglycoside phosphotransferase (APT) family kinase protein
LHHGNGRGGICASLRYSLPVGDLKRVLRGGSAVAAQDELISVLRGLGLVGGADTVRLTPLAGGVSSDIFRVETQARVFALKRALPKLKVAADWQAPVERNAYEVAWIETAAGVVPEAVPEILGHDPGNGLFAMTYLDPATHPVWKAQLRDGIVDAGFAAEVGRRVAAIHAATAGDSTVAARFATDRIFRPIRLEPYLEASARRHPGVADRLMALSRDTLAVKKALVHGDVSPKNILAGPRGPVFLDAECAWYGDPAFDLAFCLNHLLLKCLWNRAAAPAYLYAFDALAAAYLAAVAWEPRSELEARTARLLPGLFLARVDGKSPVEYITDDADRDRVRATALPLIATPPRTLAAVRSAWAERLGSD